MDQHAFLRGQKQPIDGTKYKLCSDDIFWPNSLIVAVKLANSSEFKKIFACF